MTSPSDDGAEMRVTHLCIELVATGGGDIEPRILASDNAPLPMQLGMLELAKNKLVLDQFVHETGILDDDTDDL